jgi:hypothetical protein
MSDIVLPELANAVYEERVRDADKNRWFSERRKTGTLTSFLRSLQILFTRA